MVFLFIATNLLPLTPEKSLFTTESQRSQRFYFFFPSAFLTMGKTQTALKGRMAKYVPLSAPHGNDGILLRQTSETYPEGPGIIAKT
jgi:hypothetical protein